MSQEKNGARSLPCQFYIHSPFLRGTDPSRQRCDGNQPVCGQCVNKGRQEDCEYTTAPGLTRTQLLEENIALLEARIKELENPEEGTSIKLHDPRASGSLQLNEPGAGAAPVSSSSSTDNQTIDLAQLMGLSKYSREPYNQTKSLTGMCRRRNHRPRHAFSSR